MIRVIGPVVALAGFGLTCISACSGGGDDTTTKPLGNAGNGGSSNGGTGGDGGTAPNCPACESGFCLETGECVECLSNPDTCQSGHCSEDHLCVAGCSDGNNCASGQCVDGDCVQCVEDSECSGEKVCGNGVCAAPCTGSEDCSLDCCDAHCVDVTSDVANCGGCGIACNDDEFCSGYACVAATLSNLCQTAKMAVILDGIDVDNDAAGVLRAAVEANCDPLPTLRNESQATTHLFNPATGQPVAGGGEMLLVGGGPFGQKHVAYLEDNGITSVYSKLGDGNLLEFRESGSNNVVVSAPFDSVTASHDFFVIQIARDPTSGTATAMAYGFFDAGTTAAAWYFAHQLMPALSTFTAPWYVFEWTDANGDKAPSADEITMAGHG